MDRKNEYARTVEGYQSNGPFRFEQALKAQPPAQIKFRINIIEFQKGLDGSELYSELTRGNSLDWYIGSRTDEYFEYVLFGEFEELQTSMYENRAMLNEFGSVGSLEQKIEEPQGLYQLELTIAEDEPGDFVDEIAKMGMKATLLEEFGPSGGHPEYMLEGTFSQLMDYFFWTYSYIDCEEVMEDAVWQWTMNPPVPAA